MGRVNIKEIIDKLEAAEQKDWEARHAAWVAFDKAKKQMPEWVEYKRLKDRIRKDKSPSESERKERRAAWGDLVKAEEQMPEWLEYQRLKNEYNKKWGELGKVA